MNEVLARLQELEEALDDPLNVWQRLRKAWDLAQDESDPRMAEIVRQAREIWPRLASLENRIRKVLRRNREMISLDRVQEMDRASMRWLVRQPGRNIAERAGSNQRILATVRRENFDTPENRVLHAYCILASDISREWLREHPGAEKSSRFKQVKAFRKKCRAFSAILNDLEVSVAAAGIVPNYVLNQDVSYRKIYEAWMRLLARQRTLDDLWAWQAETWTDFAVLALVLALDSLENSELIAQSPLAWHAEARMGRWFYQDRPMAVFWFRGSGRIVEVLPRPQKTGELQALSRAHVSLKITDPGRHMSRRIAVWTPHSMERIDIGKSVVDANELLNQIQKVPSNEIMKNGLILSPGHGQSEIAMSEIGPTRINGIAFGAVGEALGFGLNALADFAQGNIFQDSI
jgi:hypothetical protein